MSTLQFIPWCPITEKYSVGEISVIPFERSGDNEYLDEMEASQARITLSSYKKLDGKPVCKAAIIQYGNKPILADLSRAEMGITKDCIDLACFCGLAGRSYFDPIGRYCNADNFIWYGQQFQEKLKYPVLITRRLEGRTTNIRQLSKTSISVPVHVSSVTEVVLDDVLISALLGYRASTSTAEWAHWQNAIACFNQANTDRNEVSEQVEWVLLCSAFERLLDSKPNAKDIARLFAEAFTPSEPHLVNQATRISSRWKIPTKPLRYEWAREFYTVRGDFAHGRLETNQPMAWNSMEHLVLAKIAFPLLTRCLLAEFNNIELTESDIAQIDAFEKFADDNFLEEPPAQSGSTDSFWRRHVMVAGRKLSIRRAVESFETPDQN